MCMTFWICKNQVVISAVEVCNAVGEEGNAEDKDLYALVKVLYVWVKMPYAKGKDLYVLLQMLYAKCKIWHAVNEPVNASDQMPYVWGKMLYVWIKMPYAEGKDTYVLTFTVNSTVEVGFVWKGEGFASLQPSENIPLTFFDKKHPP